ncbi:transporter [Paeniglutamicibacter cryotolerans]|uniref:ABC-2 type transport system permease protein n=1 Tax=Paeniglutamicibacter cryotolerans TaxID=670079 RepID=A0A839QJM4_9MICC|nr:transporter [Paeniglutamicibacter cryotolerans]MBB2996399.1 ABC-2 type transport system permease protein [Paeniglutamicibacter cryotolerans]
MVAHLLALKWRLLRNGFKRSPWQLVGFIIGGLYALGVVVLLVAGLFFLGNEGPAFTSMVLTLAVSAMLLGWTLVPVLAFGVDSTLDPSRFVTFTLDRRQLVIGLLLGGFIGIPGLLTLLLFSAQALAWRSSPAAAAAALTCGVLAAVLCLAAARLSTTAATALTSNRRFRDIAGVLLIIPLFLLGPILTGLGNGFEQALGWLPKLAAVLGWTPLGSFAAVPADIAAGAWGIGALRFVLSLGYLAAVVWLWQLLLFRALENPPAVASGGKGAKGLGAFARFPAAPWGAVAARALIYWLKDPRYAASIVIVPLLPVMFWFIGSQTESYGLLMYVGPIIAVLMAFSISADVSYDSTAFALHVTSGVRGMADRAGRVVACALLAVPVVLLATVLPPVLSGRPDLLPGLLGLSLGALCTGFGVSSVASARFTYAVPMPGESPFKTPPGAGARMALVQFATFGIMGLLMLPEIGLMVAFLITGNALFGWLVLATGGVLGAVLMVLGIRLGGRWLDSRMPELMQATMVNR